MEPQPPPTEATTAGRYYGWVVAWTAFAVLTLAYGVQYCFGVFLPFIQDDLDITRTQGTLAFAVYVFVYSALSAASGWLTDRKGPRFVLVLGAIFLGVGYVLTAMAQTALQLVLALGFVAGIGMSAAFVPCNATVVRWFLHKRGRALSISTSGSSFAAVLVPLVMGGLVDRFGWRTLYVVGAGVAAAMLLAGSRLMYRDPEAKGLTMADELRGAKPLPEGTTVTVIPARDPVSLDLPAAARTVDFWLIVGLFLCTWLVVFIPLVHLSPYAKDAGSSSAVGALLVSLIGVGGLFGRGLSGNVSDRFGRLSTLTLTLVMQVVAFLAFAATAWLPVLLPAAALFGMGYGGSTVLFPALAGDRFGRAHAGAIVGAVFAGAGSLGAIGPFMAAWIHDSTDSYGLAFLIAALANVVSIGFVAGLQASGRRTVPMAVTPA
ncbi:MAG: nitrate/nitrite transporter [Acidimicrobiia bacterium]